MGYGGEGRVLAKYAAAALKKLDQLVGHLLQAVATHEGTGQDHGGKITLAVTVEGGQIANVEVVSSSETATIGELALPDYCAQIAEVQDPAAIDVSTGASNTLRGFQTAVADALANA